MSASPIWNIILVLYLTLSLTPARAEEPVNPVCPWSMAKLTDYFPIQDANLVGKRDAFVNYYKDVPATDTAAKRIAAEKLDAFDTIRIFSSSGRISPNALVRIFFSHGNGSNRSHADAMRALIRYLTDDVQGGEYKSKSTTMKIRKDPYFVQASGEAADLMQHRYGADGDQINTKEKVAEYLASYLKIMKSETPDLPLVILTRSSSAALYFEVVKQNPGLIDGFIFMSPTVPVKEWLEEGSKVLHQLATTKQEFQVDEKGLKWIDGLLAQIKWDKDSTGHIPTLILTGSADAQISPQERDFFNELTRQNENITYVDFPNADHDVFREIKGQYESDAVLNALRVVEKFLHKVVTAKPN